MVTLQYIYGVTLIQHDVARLYASISRRLVSKLSVRFSTTNRLVNLNSTNDDLIRLRPTNLYLVSPTNGAKGRLPTFRINRTILNRFLVTRRVYHINMPIHPIRPSSPRVAWLPTDPVGQTQLTDV